MGVAPLICFVGSIKLFFADVCKGKVSEISAIMPTFKAFTLQPSFVCKVCDDLGVIGNGASSYMGAHRFADHLYTVHVLSGGLGEVTERLDMGVVGCVSSMFRAI